MMRPAIETSMLLARRELGLELLGRHRVVTAARSSGMVMVAS